MSLLRWGIIGCGDVAEKKGGPALYQAEGSELIAVMRRDLTKAEDFAQRHGAKRAYDTTEALLADPEIDAVYIATPPHLHCQQTLQAAAAGKHVLVEKPMALSVAEGEQMIAACKAHSVSLHVAYYRRYWPKFQAIRAALEAGELGTVLGARLQLCTLAPASGWRVDPAISGGGHVVDVGSHRLDMLCFLLGDITEVHGFAANRLAHHSAENDTVFSLRFASGVLASACFHFHTRPSRDILEIFGSDGTLTCDPFDGAAFTINGEERRFETPTPTHLPFVQALVRGEPGHVTGEEGLKVTRLLEAVMRNKI
jgi:1,5-anhydro-D-fructose reductase (1,5-anhydro-D-mannitol-forming)